MLVEANFTSLSFNIFSGAWSPAFLIDTIRQYGLKKNIRLGLAAPISGDSGTPM